MKKYSTLAAALLTYVMLNQPSMAQGKAAPDAANQAKNVILLISDGAGINTWKAASYFRHGALGKEAYDNFDVKLFAATHPLNTSTKPTKTEEGKVTFDSANLWNNQASNASYKGSLRQYPSYLEGYHYAQTNYTDSAAAATALASGVKTYNNAINWSNNDTKLKHIGEYVVESGRDLGVVTSVQWSHATPAGFLAHNPSRNEYAAIAQEVIQSGLATVVMGAGHPYYDLNGKKVEPKDDKAYRFVGGKETWDNLAAGKTDYKLIEKKEDFEALAEGKLDLAGKTKVLGTAQNGATLQFNRQGVGAGQLLTNQPDLATMTKGALNQISKNGKGFFLMVEGGAVDWAAHANNLPRIIEEQVDFNLAVEAAVEWVEKNSSWDETLVIVTTDHGNGFLQGPDAKQHMYADIVNQGAGALPLVSWNSDNHTRELIPVFAKGVGAKEFLALAKPDANLGKFYHAAPESQYYGDNTDVFRVATKALGISTK